MNPQENAAARGETGKRRIIIKSHGKSATPLPASQAQSPHMAGGGAGSAGSDAQADGAGTGGGLEEAANELSAQLAAEISGTKGKKFSEEIITIGGVIAAIKSAHFRRDIENLRSVLEKCGGDNRHPDFRAVKTNLDAIVIAGKIEGEIAGAWERGDFEPSGFLQIDLDGIASPEMVREELRAVDYILSAFVSPSGDGVKAIAFIGKSQDANDFKTRFEVVEKDMARRGYTIDATCKNPNRLMFASWDADAWTQSTPAIPLTFAVPAESSQEKQSPPVRMPTAKASTEEAQNVTASKEFVKRLRAKSPAGNLFDSGNWQEHPFRSQSEADFSLCCSIVEVTSDHPQQEALFRASKLYRDDRKFRLAMEAARKRVAKDKALPLIWSVGGNEAEDAPAGLATYRVSHAETLGMSWAEIDALRPPVIIENFIRRGEVLLLGAESKSRKSWLTQDAGFCVAAGLPWLADENGHQGFATAQARVHVIDLELNPSEMRYRFAKARANRFDGCPINAAAMTASVAAYSLDGLNVTAILPLLEELKGSVKPGDLVIVDCLYRLCPDGNEVAPLADILETVKRFAAETQAGVILVDHFRKAGDDKARNRFAGSFIKQASASTLVAIEVTADDVLVLNIDARTFHGCPRVFARFNPETYAFDRLPEIEFAQAKAARTQAEAEGWLLRLWKGRPDAAAIGAADSAECWGIKRQTATPRLGKLVSRGWLTERKHGHGKATEWTLALDGLAIVKNNRENP